MRAITTGSTPIVALRGSGPPPVPTSAAQRLLLRIHVLPCQICWRSMRWHNGRTPRSQNLHSEEVLQDCSTFALSVVALGNVTTETLESIQRGGISQDRKLNRVTKKLSVGS